MRVRMISRSGEVSIIEGVEANAICRNAFMHNGHVTIETKDGTTIITDDRGTLLLTPIREDE